MFTEPNQPVAPTTTAQEDITLAGQRKINFIWELTQALIAIAVVISNMALALVPVFTAREAKAPESVINALFLIVGFYFSRTNHAAIGGIGSKPNDKYTGR